MKLYATVTSERACKGQGGNEFLDIIIRNENQEMIANVTVWPSGHIEYTTERKTPRTWEELQKGEKQKAECLHSYCDDDAICIQCGKQQ